VKFFISNGFIKQLSLLLEKPRDGYGSVKKDICEEIKRYANVGQLLSAKVNILDLDEGRLIKTELKNSHQKLPKNNGYRLYFIVNKQANHACFLFVYPKRGKHGLTSISDEEELGLIGEYLKQLEENSLVEVDVNNDLCEIKKPDILTDESTEISTEKSDEPTE